MINNPLPADDSHVPTAANRPAPSGNEMVGYDRASHRTRALHQPTGVVDDGGFAGLRNRARADLLVGVLETVPWSPHWRHTESLRLVRVGYCRNQTSQSVRRTQPIRCEYP